MSAWSLAALPEGTMLSMYSYKIGSCVKDRVITKRISWKPATFIGTVAFGMERSVVAAGFPEVPIVPKS